MIVPVTQLFNVTDERGRSVQVHNLSVTVQEFYVEVHATGRRMLASGRPSVFTTHLDITLADVPSALRLKLLSLAQAELQRRLNIAQNEAQTVATAIEQATP